MYEAASGVREGKACSVWGSLKCEEGGSCGVRDSLRCGGGMGIPCVGQPGDAQESAFGAHASQGHKALLTSLHVSVHVHAWT